MVELGEAFAANHPKNVRSAPVAGRPGGGALVRILRWRRKITRARATVGENSERTSVVGLRS